MKNISIIAIGLALVLKVYLVQAVDKELEFKILTDWNGTDIDHLDEPAVINLRQIGGDLEIEVSAPFYSSPVLKPTLNESCPQRSYKYVGRYEVIEVMFLNSLNEYIQFEFNPRGLYNIALVKGHNFIILNNLPLFPDGVDIANDCPVLDGPVDCTCRERWNATIQVPKEYMPFNVSKFNAYSIHGSFWGQEEPDKDELVYEALYPVQPQHNLSAPDIHFVDAFQPIDLKNDLNYPTDIMVSSLWHEARTAKNFIFEYDIDRTADCSDLPSVSYTGKVTTYRLSDESKFAVQVQVADDASIVPIFTEELRESGPNEFVGNDTESFWVSFSNYKHQMLRIAVNPFKAYKIELWEYDKLLKTENLTLSSVLCTHQENLTIWTCTLDVDWDLLPPNVAFFQMVHVHQGLNSTDTLVDAADQEFFGTVCTGLPEGVEYIDWKGCEIDARTITDIEYNQDLSDIWLSALGENATTTTSAPSTPSTTSGAFWMHSSIVSAIFSIMLSLFSI